jgi:hypothetical protein
LIFIMIEDHRAVLRAHISPLPVKLGGVVSFPVYFQYLFV